MTMRITKHQKIGGVSALDARKLLRKYHERFREDWLVEALSKLLFRRKFGHGYLYLHPEEDRELRRKAAPVIAGLVEEGFIEPDEMGVGHITGQQPAVVAVLQCGHVQRPEDVLGVGKIAHQQSERAGAADASQQVVH